MADELTTEPQAPALAELAEAIAAELVNPLVLEKLRKHVQESRVAEAKDLSEMAWSTLPFNVERIVAAIIEWTSLPPVIGRGLARAATDTLLGDGIVTGGETAEIGRRIIEKLSGPSAQVQPGYDAAAAYMGLMLGEQIEAWARGVFAELVSGLAPAFLGVAGGVESFAKLQDIVETALGGQRMVRRVLQPFIQARIVTPAQWQANKDYRPELLSPAELARQVARGRMSREAALEEMARQGWSDDRAEALLSNAAKFFGVADAFLAMRAGMWTEEQARQHLRDQGYTVDQADHAIRLQDAREVAQFEEQLAGAALAAFVDRRIDRAEFTSIVHASVRDRRVANRIVELGETRRALNRRNLSATEARRLARAELLTPADFRRALEREGYEPDAITALELELRVELQEQRDLEKARQEQEAERQAEKERRAAERAARDEELAAKRARAYQSLSDARRLYVRGIIARDRYEAALVAEKLPNLDVAAYLADADDDRAEYLEALERKRQAEARDTGAVVPLTAIEQAVMRGILTIHDYEAQVRDRGFDANETRILVQLLADRLEEQQHAADARAAADRRAQLAGVSLGTWERAVRLGVRTRAEYSAFLVSIETPDTARALILDLLDRQLELDAEAQAKRDAAEEAAAQKGISLEQRYRAVVRGVLSIEEYARALAETAIPVEDQQILIDMLAAEADAAAEARARRDALASRVDDAELTLAQVERAVKLNLLSPDDLRERARRKGLSADDVELLVALVVADIPDVRQGQRLERAVAEELRTRNLSLAEQKQLVARGLRTLDDYAAWLRAQGYGDDNVALLRQLLEEETAADLEGLRKRIAATLAKAEDAPTIDAFTDALRAGELTVDQFRDALASWGVGRDEALIFGRLLLLLEP